MEDARVIRRLCPCRFCVTLRSLVPCRRSAINIQVPNVKTSRKKFMVSLAIAAGLVLQSCAVFKPGASTAVLEVSSRSLMNGHLIQIVIDRPVGTVTAFVSRGNWLIVTLEDSLLDTPDVESFRSQFTDSVEVTRFPVALQLAFHLTITVEAVEVIHEEPSPEVLISLFANPKKRGKGTS